MVVKHKIKISNNILSALLIFAILSMVLSVWVSFDTLSPLTGEATGNATVTTNVTIAVDCTTTTGDGDNLIAFGNLARNTESSSQSVTDYHAVENNGNSNLTIEAYAIDTSTNQLWEWVSSPSIYWKVACNSTDSGTCNASYGILGSEAVKTYLGTHLGVNSTNDLMTIGINITVPDEEPTGQKSGVVTYYCTEA